MWHSADEGETWSPQTSGTSSTLLDVFFLDDLHGWAVGQSIILHTADGGANWGTQWSTAGSITLEAVEFVDALTGWAVGGSVSGSILMRTTDGGANWDPVDTSPFFNTSNNLLDISAAVDGVGGVRLVVAGGTGIINLVATSDDLGLTWQPGTVPNAASPGAFSTVQMLDSMTGYLSAAGASNPVSQILETVDGGATWELFHDFSSGGGVGHHFFLDPERGWASVSDHSSRWTIYHYRMEEAGLEWNPAASYPDDRTTASHLAFFDQPEPATGLAVGATSGFPAVLRSVDDGVSWVGGFADPVFQFKGIAIPLPEPAAPALLACGAALLIALRRRRSEPRLGNRR